mgnify:CR=1 FL=1
MLNIVSKIGEDFYQINGSEIPVDKDTLSDMLQETAQLSNTEITNWYSRIEIEGTNSFIDKIADKSTIVEMYEVEHPKGADVNKHLHRQRDLESKEIFPGILPEEITITTLPKATPLNTSTEAPEHVTGGERQQVANKLNWREILNGK